MEEKFEGCIGRRSNNTIVIEAKSNQRKIEIIFSPEDFAYALTNQPRNCVVKERFYPKKD
jgi:hypothetical protein